MGKKLTEEELLNRLFKGDLQKDLEFYQKENEFIGVTHETDVWEIKLKHKSCGTEYKRTIPKLQRHQECPNKACKVKKQKDTKFNLYGDPNYNNLQQMIDTKIKVYGNSFGTRLKIAETKSKLDQKAIAAKMVSTRRSLYGSKYVSDQDRSVESWRESMKNNKSNMSVWEEEAYTKLLSKFKDVYYNYYDKTRYPYLCDFYIKDIDTFIELNYHWSHGSEPYIASKKQIKEVLIWYNKGWLNNIKVWTLKDVKKRTVAKTNNLNYKEFFTRGDFNNWINSKVDA